MFCLVWVYCLFVVSIDYNNHWLFEAMWRLDSFKSPHHVQDAATTTSCTRGFAWPTSVSAPFSSAALADITCQRGGKGKKTEPLRLRVLFRALDTSPMKCISIQMLVGSCMRQPSVCGASIHGVKQENAWWVKGLFFLFFSSPSCLITEHIAA